MVPVGVGYHVTEPIKSKFIQLELVVKLVMFVTRLTIRDFPYKNHVSKLMSHMVPDG